MRLKAPKRAIVPLLALVAAGIAVGVILGVTKQSDPGASPAGFDLSTDAGHAAIPGFSTRDLVAGAPAAQIPAILHPRFDSAGAASRLLRGTDPVLGLDVQGDARAYPTQLLALHEVV